MSRQHVDAYPTHIAKLHAVSGSLNEGVVSAAFGKLLESWGGSLDLTLVNQWEGITDWALGQFRTRYAAEAPDLGEGRHLRLCLCRAPRPRLLHDLCRRPAPRVSAHPAVRRLRPLDGVERTLLDLHIGYETVEPADLTRIDAPTGKPPTPKLKSLPDTGVIVLDSDTQLTGVPRGAWDYRLGNRSAIDWVLDQHKEKIKDPTVARLFDTYRFADHKERVIDLLGRVVAVSPRRWRSRPRWQLSRGLSTSVGTDHDRTDQATANFI